MALKLTKYYDDGVSPYYQCSDCGAINSYNDLKCQGCKEPFDDVTETVRPGTRPGENNGMGKFSQAQRP